ncbi:MAG: two-component system response regulator [Bacteroidetes bacterium]|nr:two-component system response regulator [Bacteroidota bacterium]
MKKKILIVDDSAPMRFLLEAMLGNKYKVYAATDGLTATMWLSSGNIVVIQRQYSGSDHHGCANA